MPEQGNEVVYLGGEVSASLGIARSSLTKYCLALEGKGYHFIKGSNNSRRFTNKDILLLQRMKDLVQEKVMTMETAVNVVLSMLPEDARTGLVLDGNKENKVISNEVILKEEQFREQENKVIALMMERLEQFNGVVDRLNFMERELKEIKMQNQLLKDQNEQLKAGMETTSNKRDEQLLSIIRDVQDTKKMIAAAREKKWWKFW